MANCSATPVGEDMDSFAEGAKIRAQLGDRKGKTQGGGKDSNPHRRPKEMRECIAMTKAWLILFLSLTCCKASLLFTLTEIRIGGKC